MANKDKFKIGDWVLPRIVGLLEYGDPPYQIVKIEDGIYTIVPISFLIVMYDVYLSF